MKRKALGKGLSSLIPEVPPRVSTPRQQQQAAEGLKQIDIDRISPNSAQPRQIFDETALNDLAASLQNQGFLQPVVVRPRPDGSFELIAGERRWRASQIAGFMKIPALIRDVADEQMLEYALIENLQREDLNPIEAASAFQALINDLNLSQEEVAQRVGKGRATVANALRLLNLPKPVQQFVKTGQISAGHAKALASLTESAVQITLAKKIAGSDLSVRQVEAMVARARKSRKGTAATAGTPEQDPNVQAASDVLQSALGTRVKIVSGKKGGRIELHFFSSEELERVYQLILNATNTKQ